MGAISVIVASWDIRKFHSEISRVKIMINFDFHIHSAPYSGCAGQTVKEAVKRHTIVVLRQLRFATITVLTVWMKHARSARNLV